MTTHKITLAERNVKAFAPVRRHRSECSCGWKGEWRRAQNDAVADGDYHRGWAKEDAAA